jgi:hypothetical protein
VSTSAALYSAAGNFVLVSIDKCRLVVTGLVVFWWYGLAPFNLYGFDDAIQPAICARELNPSLFIMLRI